MTAILAAALAAGLWALVVPAGSSRRRLRAALSQTPVTRPAGRGGALRRRRVDLRWSARRGRELPGVSMTVVVQQLSALLKGGRSSARLWEELWLLYAGGTAPGRPAAGAGPRGPAGTAAGSLSALSLEILAAARAAAAQGSPVAAAIRRRAGPAPGATARRGADGSEQAVWVELAACFELAEASGCPLAEVLTRFAGHLEAADDAAAARQTALAGPKTTVRILTWLPFLGLGLGMLLGVDAAAVLVGTPLGLASLGAGLLLTAAGRLWSARLVRLAEGRHP